MNPQIQKLIEQCTTTATSYFYNRGNVTDSYFDQEKFAELIVQECASVARNADLEDVEGGDSSVLYAAAEQIKKHFGFG